MSEAHDEELELPGGRVRLLAERAAYWPERRTLIVADLHWGKSEVLQRAGIPLPSGALQDDLERLGRAITRTGAERVLALGDLVHAPRGITAAVSAEVAAWRARHAQARFVLIRGNHDRKLAVPESWALEEAGTQLIEGGFRFVHELEGTNPAKDLVTWSGHVHPTVVLRAGRDRVRVPAFVVRRLTVLVPAFGSLTGGFDITTRPGDRIFAVADRHVIETTRQT